MLYQGTCISQVMSWLGWPNMVYLTGPRIIRSETPGISLRELLDWVNWGKKIHPDYRQNPSTGWGPRINTRKIRASTHTRHFPIEDVMLPAASSSCHLEELSPATVSQQTNKKTNDTFLLWVASVRHFGLAMRKVSNVLDYQNEWMR